MTRADLCPYGWRPDPSDPDRLVEDPDERATPGGKGNSDVGATKMAAADLSTVAASLALGGQDTSRYTGANVTSQPANDGPTSAQGAAVVLPQQATTSLATASPSGVKTSHTSAIESDSAPFLEDLWDDPLT